MNIDFDDIISESYLRSSSIAQTKGGMSYVRYAGERYTQRPRQVNFLQGFELPNLQPDLTRNLYQSEDYTGTLGTSIHYKYVGYGIRRVHHRLVLSCFQLDECLSDVNFYDIFSETYSPTFEGFNPIGNYYSLNDGKGTFNWAFEGKMVNGFKYFGAGLIFTSYRNYNSKFHFSLVNRTTRSFTYEIETFNKSLITVTKVFYLASNQGKFNI
jgi:hypothetical protein